VHLLGYNKLNWSVNPSILPSSDLLEEAVPESVKNSREPEQEAQNDADDNMHVTVRSVDEDGQWWQDDTENELDDLLDFDGHFEQLKFDLQSKS